MNNINGFGHLSEIDILSLEEKYDIVFPNDYKEFLENYNGGLPAKNYLTTHLDNIGEEIVLGSLLGINENENFDLGTWLFEYEDELPPSSFIIGTEYNSGLFIMITIGDEQGVYFWDDAYELKSSSDEENVYFLASTFSGFLNRFSVEE
ncbi:SMI1/KNR4 family protein [Enterococcus plantarum]|uniref:SMI1/KNR4 family protein n=1 Tax=Enterococcus plantarum TaxID=1077675 RepID=UPI001A8C933D|nr:SMI1/KNR4 family protein [Enterococcus plantarum]MBO0468837.1 SMI1/KNR4 family protein [Enterococcus plantarum]